MDGGTDELDHSCPNRRNGRAWPVGHHPRSAAAIGSGLRDLGNRPWRHASPTGPIASRCAARLRWRGSHLPSCSLAGGRWPSSHSLPGSRRQRGIAIAECHEREMALVEAIASWTEQIRDTLAAANGLEQALSAAPRRPDAIAPEVDGSPRARVRTSCPMRSVDSQMRSTTHWPILSSQRCSSPPRSGTRPGFAVHPSLRRRPQRGPDALAGLGWPSPQPQCGASHRCRRAVRGRRRPARAGP